MSDSSAASDAAPQPSPPAGGRKKVTVVGAGIAGLTTAYRLAQRGYDVTVLEAQSLPGGNLAGLRDEDGKPVFEVYPHMFGDWYDNFWALMADIGITRGSHFVARPVCGFLRAGEFPQYRLLRDNGSPRSAIQNLLSEIMSIPNMFLAAYAIIDLLTHDFDHDDLTREQSLNGFIVSRPYATVDVARFFQLLVLTIWSNDSYSTAAGAYQAFAKYQFRRPAPQSWVLRTNSYEAIVEPLRAALAAMGCHIHCHKKLTGVSVDQATHRVTRIAIESDDAQEVETLVLAITPTALHEVIMHWAALAVSDPHAPSRGISAEVPIVEFLPELAGTRGLATAPIPVVYAAFNRALPDIPDYYVALTGSRYSLTFVRSAALSDAYGKTVLVIAASDFNTLPVELEFSPFDRSKKLTAAQEIATFLILSEFHRYVPNFRLGDHFGDSRSDIDWELTRIGSGSNQQLFINRVGSGNVVPYTHYPEIQNLYFAGENRDNPITIATVEAAVCSGNQAAQAICRDLGQAPGVAPVNVLVPATYPMAAVLAWKFALAPYAAAAKCWATLEESLGGSRIEAQRTPDRPTRLGLGHAIGQTAAAAADVYCGWLNAYGSVLGRVAREFRSR